MPPGGTEPAAPTTATRSGSSALAILVDDATAPCVRGSRPAAVALLVLALARAARSCCSSTCPVLDDTGLIGRTYDLAEARPRAGFYLESLGAALALLGAVRARVTLAGAAADRQSTVRTSLPRTWPASIRSCALGGPLERERLLDVRAQAALGDQRRDVLAEVVAARAHEDVV